MKLFGRMKFIIFINFMCSIWAESIYVKSSSITAVRILRNIVEIQREFVATGIKSGYSTVVLQHLPQSVDEQSIRIKGKGDSMITLLSTVVRNVVVRRNDDELFTHFVEKLAYVRQQILEEIDGYSTDYSRIKLRLGTVETYVQAYLEKRGSSTSAVESRITPAEMMDVLDFQDKEMKSSNNAILTLRSSLNMSNAALATVNGAIEALVTSGIYNPLACEDLYPHISDQVVKAKCEDLPLASDAMFWPASKSEKELVLKLHMSTSAGVSEDVGQGRHAFTLTHFANTATWQPEYDVHLDGSASTEHKESGHSLQIDFFATVTQNTGEDWLDTTVELSTAFPSQMRDAPRPHRISVSYVQQKMASLSTRGFNARLHKAPMMQESMSADVAGMAPEMMNYDMAVAEAEVSSTGDLSAAVVFSLPHKHTILTGKEKLKRYQVAKHSDHPQLEYSVDKDRILISSLKTPSMVYSYAVPTAPEKRAFLRAWGRYEPSGTALTAVPPLLETDSTRVFLQGQYSGQTRVPATQPGALLRLALGEDKNIHISATKVLPTYKTKEDEASGWFVTEKKKYHIKSEDWAISVTSSYDRPHLLVLAEFLPHSTEEDIEVNLISPSPESVVQLDKTLEDPDEILAAVLSHSSLRLSSPHAATVPGEMATFLSPKTHHVVWAKWLQPRETIRFNYKYRILWPEARGEVYIY